MGLLDDAIREHLELKRRHGGDPGEIERQEREALGPTGARDAEEPQPPGQEPDEAPDAPEDFAADAPTTVQPAAPAAVAADEVEPPPGEEEVPSAGHEADAPSVSGIRPSPPASPRDEDPWLEVDEDAPRTERRAAEDDVLEETPDFLQETPEHDRLWFEQKPPRDFDWDR